MKNRCRRQVSTLSSNETDDLEDALAYEAVLRSMYAGRYAQCEVGAAHARFGGRLLIGGHVA